MWSIAREVAAGDLVIVWLTRDTVQSLLITPGKDFNSKFGNYRHSDLIGLPYGSKVRSHNGKGFIHVLRPTPELWTMALPHRTQILYMADIAFVTSFLDIKRGSRVIEAGTGSGSFSHSVARTVGPSGHLWSYEFHEARANKAREEFERHGLSDTITLTHRNVCKEGFTVVDTVDSVFLDLPAPWDAVEHAKKALRKDRTTRICCFSPCMEQVLRTVSALNDAGFTGITMYETLLRPHDVTQIPTPVTVDQIGERIKGLEQKREEKRLRQIASGRAGRYTADPQTQLTSASTSTSTTNAAPGTSGAAAVSASAGSKRKRDGDAGDDDDDDELGVDLPLPLIPSSSEQNATTQQLQQPDPSGIGSDQSILGTKRAKTKTKAKTENKTNSVVGSNQISTADTAYSGVDNDNDNVVTIREEDLDDAMMVDVDVTEEATAPVNAGDTPSNSHPSTSAVGVKGASRKTKTVSVKFQEPAGTVDDEEDEINDSKIIVSKAFPEVRGHTSYLTFAVLQPTISARRKAVQVPTKNSGSVEEAEEGASNLNAQVASSSNTSAGS